MKAFILQHVPFEKPGAILTWLKKQNFEIHHIHLFENPSFPELSEVDWVIVMGGPMSIHEEKEFPWFIQEKKFIGECIGADKKVIGVCLGAQLIASVLGSKIYKNPVKEIGWFHLKDVKSGIPEGITVFHWHGETFELPVNSQLLASTENCRNQIFKYGTNVLAMQCHLEMTQDAISGMLTNCADELQPAPYIQTAEEIHSGTEIFSTEANQVLFSLLHSLL